MNVEESGQTYWHIFCCCLVLLIFINQYFLHSPSESVVSKAQSPLTRTSRRNQSKAKSRVVESEVNVELLETLCKDNECNAEEVCHFFLLCRHHFYSPWECGHFPLCDLHLQVKNVYQTSFSAFLDLMDLSRFPDFPLVRAHSVLRSPRQVPCLLIICFSVRVFCCQAFECLTDVGFFFVCSHKDNVGKLCT